MIFITDELGKFEKNIIELAENMGFKECKTIEAIDLFCGISEKNDVLKEKDRYYAFIDIPQYWSVRADGLNGAIYDNKTKKANIYFKNPIEKRMVSRVEWIDRNNTVYKVDYYNKYGYMYCSENVSGGNVTVREFYDRNGDIKVLEQTGPKTYTTFGTRISPKSYRGFADYLEAYLKYNKIYDENIWLTSDEILNKFAWDYGNFKISYLPQNRLNSDLTVITQTNTAFRILCSEEQQVNWYKENSNYKCDRVYSYFENNELKFGKKEALTITESDQLEYIEQLINDFPEITFHIAASTIMSDKLTRLDINNNVELYPCITEQKRKELFERCDIYLDINHYRELYNAVNEAMVNNMIILAFDNTAHSKELYPMGNIFESSNYVKMKETLKNIITSQTIFNEYIDRQKKQLKQLAAKVVIPDYWRIEGDNSSAKVMDRTRERARIFFTEPTHRRQVKIVDWLDDAGQVRLSEHYNRYGAIFCHTVFNKKGQKALRKFFDVTGREMIVENFVTGDILVRWQDKDWIFRSKTDFIAFFIRCAGLEDTAVYFNSLSYPFFASQALAPNGFRDALFWHEPVGDEIPGNMQIILHDQGTRAKRVFVSRRESYDRLIALGAPSDKVKQLGYIYSFVRENKHRPHILVCTNSENVGHLTELASLMPQMHFHVAAITEMSSKLMSAGQYDNVSLYPNVKMSVLDSLFEKCDFYLDINHEGEIVDAVHRAFLNNMLIVGYEETMHNAYYTADTNTFKESEYANMAEALNLTLAMPHLIDEALAMQKKAAVAADATDYMEILHL